MATEHLVCLLGVKTTSPTGPAMAVLLHDVVSRGVGGMVSLLVSSSTTSSGHPAIVR